MPPVKIHFRLVQDEDSYPPVAVESVWAEPAVEPGEYVIDNVPFFAQNATIGDTVRVREEGGLRWFESMVRRSRNSLIRIAFFDRTRVEGVSQHLVSLGCSVEYSKDYNLVAVNIPDGVELTDVQAYLQAEANAGMLDFEEPILRQ